MEKKYAHFVPPAPEPLTTPMSKLQLIRAVYRNPLEIWGTRAFTEPYVESEAFGVKTLLVNDLKMVRHVLVDNAANYAMAPLRQRVLRPILRDGLLTAEGDIWKRSRKAMAPVFTPRHIKNFATTMLVEADAFAKTYKDGETRDLAPDMTVLTYNILAATLFSDEIAGDRASFEHKVNDLLDTMGRLDPLDLIGAPDWVPRLTHFRGRKPLTYFRDAVKETMAMRRKKLADKSQTPPEDFLTLLLRLEGPEGLTEGEIEDNIITFIGAGHETTARALGWTLYLLAEAPNERALVEAEIDDVTIRISDPNDWLAAMPKTRAAFEEALRLYPPAASLNRAALKDDVIGDLAVSAGTTVLVMPWTLHRHHAHWDQPNAFMPERFWPENRDKIDRFQYLPFGGGPRVCIGQSFALTEGVIALASLMKHWRFDTYRRRKPWPVQKLTIQAEGGLSMRVSARH